MDEIDRDLKKPLGFKPNTDFLSPESITFLQELGGRGERSKWISRACEFYYDYENYKKGLLIRILENNFELCKHLLRIIGRRKK